MLKEKHERKAWSLPSIEEFNKIYSGLFFARFLSLDMLLVTTPLLGVMHSPITVSSNDPSMSSSAQSLGSPRGCVRISRILVTGISSNDPEAVFVLLPEGMLSSTNPDFPPGLPPLADSSSPSNLAAISSQEYGNPSWKRSQICSKRQSWF
ncbi:PREDICTED: uncharacterized protein LOC105134349 [Populus euphratica]|uniref:Uncharacterized protein LOC105134349 n=1 Tax=Populus euphratica TaxID=75702 RepID=A0AAJ6UWQ4_POPEU|nr:PREDICTED: uncharacterized protein LOC105134349 [Populus euphratica]